jgi:hypothetical protein
LLAVSTAARAAEQPSAAFGDSVEFAPFVVKGEKISISIHARTKSDRKYGSEFAEEVVGIAYETIEKSTGAGLVIVGREGEPHPIVVIRRFQELAAAGQLDPAIAARSGELEARLKEWKAIMRLDEPQEDAENPEGFKITFDMIVPALPLPLEGLAAQLYQLSWAEGFDDKRVEQRLRTLTAVDLAGELFAKYDWVFYLPPRNAYVGVQNAVVKGAIEKEKMGFFKRNTLRGALAVFKPMVKSVVEAFRKGMLYMAVLRARSDYPKDDIQLLTEAYTQVMMPNFKIDGGSERQRALEAIAKQKVRNAEYAKDPFVSPPRLATFDAAAYASFAGAYGTVEKPKKGKAAGKPSRMLVRQDDAWLWQYRHGKPATLFPAGECLLVSLDGKLTVEFKVDEQGVVTAAEERRGRHRETFPRSL